MRSSLILPRNRNFCFYYTQICKRKQFMISWNKQDFLQPTSLRGAFCRKWILPRPKKQSTGLFLTFTSFGPVFRIPTPIQIRKPTRRVSFLIWSEYRDSNPRPLGPEPSAIPNFAIPRNPIYYNGIFFRCQCKILDLFL